MVRIFIFHALFTVQNYFFFFEYASFSAKNLSFACIFIDFDRLREVFFDIFGRFWAESLIQIPFEGLFFGFLERNVGNLDII